MVKLRRHASIFHFVVTGLVPHLFDALRGHVADDLRRHVEVLGGDVAQRDAVLREQLGEGVNRAAVLQISDHSYLTGNTRINT